jgi:microcystin degradation protein MlrC
VSPIRIAIVGISSESSTFSLGPTGPDRFQVLRGEELLTQYGFEGRIDPTLLEGVEWVPVMRAAGQSGGPLVPEMVDAFQTEMLDGLRERLGGGYDGVYLDMHGAMHVAGRVDAEEWFITEVRRIVGPDPVLAMSMDPHGNLSAELATLVDLAACHRHSPHIDAADTVDRTVTDLLRTIRSGRRPVKAWVEVPMLLPGERSGTFVEPGRTVFGALAGEAAALGIVDANLWVSYAWGDEPRNAASVLVTADDADAAVKAAERIAASYWSAREAFTITAERVGEIDDALDMALAEGARPVFVSDSGDNITGGGDGDTTVALHALLARERAYAAHGARVVVAGLIDAAAVDAAVAVGAGGTLDIAIGATLNHAHAPAVDGPWEVVRVIQGRYGEGDVAALLRSGHVDVSVQRRRAVFTSPDDPAYVPRKILGQAFFDTSCYAIVVVKNGYLFPGQVDAAGSHIMALTPGGTDLRVDGPAFRRLRRPIFPLDRDFTPDLSATILPAWTVGTTPSRTETTP